VILKTVAELADMRAGIDLERVGDCVGVEHVVKLAGVGA
jgi:hypothetical protein